MNNPIQNFQNPQNSQQSHKKQNRYNSQGLQKPAKDPYGNSLDDQVPFYFGNELHFARVDPASVARKEQEEQQLSAEQYAARRDELEQDKPWLRDNFAYDPHTAEVLAEATAHTVLRDMFATFDKASRETYNQYSDAEAVKGRADFQMLTDSHIADAMETFETKPHLLSFVQQHSTELKNVFSARNERIARERLTKAVNSTLGAARLPYLEALQDPDSEPDVLEAAKMGLGITMVAQGRFNKQTSDEYHAEYDTELEKAEQQRNLKIVKNLCESLNDTHKSFAIHRETLQQAEGIYLQEKLVEAVGQRPSLRIDTAKQAQEAINECKLNPMEVAAFKFQLGLAEGKLQKEEAFSEEDVFVMAGRIKDIAQEALQKVEMEAIQQQQDWKQADLNKISKNAQSIDTIFAIYTALFQEITHNNIAEKDDLMSSNEVTRFKSQDESVMLENQKTNFKRLFNLSEDVMKNREIRRAEKFALQLFLHLKDKYPEDLKDINFFTKHTVNNVSLHKYKEQNYVQNIFNDIHTMYNKDPAQYIITYTEHKEILNNTNQKLILSITGGEAITEKEFDQYIGILIDEQLKMGMKVEELQFFSTEVHKAIIKAENEDNREEYAQFLQNLKNSSLNCWKPIKKEILKASPTFATAYILFALESSSTPQDLEKKLGTLVFGSKEIFQFPESEDTRFAPKDDDLGKIVGVAANAISGPIGKSLGFLFSFGTFAKTSPEEILMQQVTSDASVYSFVLQKSIMAEMKDKSETEQAKHVATPILLTYALIKTQKGNGYINPLQWFVDTTLSSHHLETEQNRLLIASILKEAYGNIHIVNLNTSVGYRFSWAAPQTEESFVNYRATAVPDEFDGQKINVQAVQQGIIREEQKLDWLNIVVAGKKNYKPTLDCDEKIWFYEGNGKYVAYYRIGVNNFRPFIYKNTKEPVVLLLHEVENSGK